VKCEQDMHLMFWFCQKEALPAKSLTLAS